MDTLCTKVRTLTEIQVPFIPSFIGSLPPATPMRLDLIGEEDVVPVVRTKRGQEVKLQDPTMDIDQALERATISSMVSQSVEEKS